MHNAFYCKRLKLSIGPLDVALMDSDIGWICDCGAWYNPYTGVEYIANHDYVHDKLRYSRVPKDKVMHHTMIKSKTL